MSQPWNGFGISDLLISCFVAGCMFPLTSCNVSAIISGRGADFSVTEPRPVPKDTVLICIRSKDPQSEGGFGGTEDAL